MVLAQDTVQSETVDVVHDDEEESLSSSSSGGPSVTGSSVQLPTEIPKILIHGK